jgi:hypothetical protein
MLYVFLLVVTAAASRGVLSHLTIRAWQGLSESHPDYAKELYVPRSGAKPGRMGRLSWRVLFSKKAPADVQVVVIKLKAAAIATGVTRAACVGDIAVLLFAMSQSG